MFWCTLLVGFIMLGVIVSQAIKGEITIDTGWEAFEISDMIEVQQQHGFAAVSAITPNPYPYPNPNP
jgi:hypothetical protein